MRFIRANLSGQLRLQDIAAQAGLSPDHFSHLFRKYTLLSPKAYLRVCRMQTARELLISTTLPVAEIAMTVGYSSPSLFYRHIEKSFGKKPLDIRRSGSRGV